MTFFVFECVHYYYVSKKLLKQITTTTTQIKHKCRINLNLFRKTEVFLAVAKLEEIINRECAKLLKEKKIKLKRKKTNKFQFDSIVCEEREKKTR